MNIEGIEIGFTSWPLLIPSVSLSKLFHFSEPQFFFFSKMDKTPEPPPHGVEVRAPYDTAGPNHNRLLTNSDDNNYYCFCFIVIVRFIKYCDTWFLECFPSSQ